MTRMVNDADDTHHENLAVVAKVATYLSLSRSKVYALMDAGELPFIKFGKSRRIRWSDVEALVAKNTVARS
ncbi:MAG: helix-turn-helix domain-containing protein [Pirellulales bacterium]